MRYNQIAKLELDKGDLILTSPYHRGLVEAIKALPYNDRSYIPDTKQWRIKYMWGDVVATACLVHFGYQVTVPKQITYSDEYVQTRLFRVDYIGSVRERDDGSQTATGFTNGGWNIILPRNALKEWFGQDSKPGESITYYGVLGIKRKATPDEVKKAYRLAARTWHPDVNHEPDAHEQFMKIHKAYEVLSDTQMRRKYDAALMFERDANRDAKKRNEQKIESYGWQPPLRCGWLMVEGTESIGRFNVQRILQWNDILNETGLSMVSFWDERSKNFICEWL
jgi:DnaJ-like protein